MASSKVVSLVFLTWILFSRPGMWTIGGCGYVFLHCGFPFLEIVFSETMFGNFEITGRIFRNVEGQCCLLRIPLQELWAPLSGSCGLQDCFVGTVFNKWTCKMGREMIWNSKRAQSRTAYRALLAGMRCTATAYRDPMRYTAYRVDAVRVPRNRQIIHRLSGRGPCQWRRVHLFSHKLLGFISMA